MNEALLDYQMAVHHVGKSEICMELGITRSTFYRKRKGISEFNQSEIQKIMKLLGLTADEAANIFFN